MRDTLNILWFVASPLSIIATATGNPPCLAATTTTSSNEQFEKLTDGRCDAVITAIDNVFAWNLRNGPRDFIIVGQIERTTPLSIIAGKSIASFDDLKGRELIVDSAENGFVVALMAILNEHGLPPGSYTMREVGGVRERYQYLAHHRDTATLLGPPFVQMAINGGMTILARILDHYVDFPGQAIVIRRGLSYTKQMTVRHWLDCMRAALDASRTDIPFAEKLLTDAGYETEQATDAIRNFPISTVPDQQGIQRLLDMRLALGLPSASQTLESFVDYTYQPGVL